MITIIKNDPAPVLIDGKINGSLRPEDYTWGYTDLDKKEYLFHAESFYQLYILRYGHANLTPYMMKLIDVGPILMDKLPFSLGRFQAEAGEHANYDHNCFYYQHTTRHGGRQKIDPILSLLRTMWKNLCYNIVTGDGSKASQMAAEAFLSYKRKHLSASIIQRWYRIRYSKKQKAASVIQKCYRKWKKIPVFNVTNNQSNLIFEGLNFVLCGSVPKAIGGLKNMTQGHLMELILQHGGRVRKSLPGGNNLCTKMYVVLCSPQTSGKKKLPIQLKEAYRKGHKMLDFKYIMECINQRKLLNEKSFTLTMPQHFIKRCSRNATLEHKHFSKAKLMTSLVKRKRKQRRRDFKKQKRIHGSNPCMHYVSRKLREVCATQKLSFANKSRMYSYYMAKWKGLSLNKKRKERTEWRAKMESKLHLESYNESGNTAYLSFL